MQANNITPVGNILRDSEDHSVCNSVWDSIEEAVDGSVMHSVFRHVWDGIWDSVRRPLFDAMKTKEIK